PLLFASFVGLFACGAALVAGVAAVINGLLGGSLGGWLGLTALVTLLAGGQLLALGVLGEYLGRLYEGSRGRPVFWLARIVRQGHRATEAVTPERATIRMGPSGAARAVGGSSKVA